MVTHSEDLARLKERFDDFVVIVSPPRAASTALARVFWEHPAVAFYSHEPFDSVYYNGGNVDEALRHISDPLVLDPYSAKPPCTGKGIVVKEMTFQVGRHFEVLAHLTSCPIVFLIRDPRLSVFSRLRYLAITTDDFSFPFEETGWGHLVSQVEWCQRNDVPYLLVDSAEFRKTPHPVLGELFTRLGLAFYEEQLSWNTLTGLELGNLDGEQALWYERVLASTGVEEPDERVPGLEVFDPVPGLREHVEDCLEIYDTFTKDLAKVGGQAVSAGALSSRVSSHS